MSIAEKLTTIAENVPKVYEAGKKSEYDAFWDVYQNYGKRTQYNYAFAGSGWDDRTFKPKYSIKPVQATYMFAQSDIDSWDRVELDTSNMTSCSYMFQSCFSEKIPPIDVTKVTSQYNLNYIFATCTSLKTIEKLIVSENTAYHNAMFTGTKNLENIIFEGTIAKNNLDLSPCTKLSGESIVSVIEALSDTKSGLTVTLSQTAVDNMAFPITGNNGTYNSWTDLEQSKTNWTISLV